MFAREEKRRQRQEEVLLLLDMRLACLLVDGKGSGALREHLFQLRRKLEQDLLDTQTLAAVESTVRALTQQPKPKPVRASAKPPKWHQVTSAADHLSSREIAVDRLRGLQWRNAEVPAPRPQPAPQPSQRHSAPILARTGGVAGLTGFFGLALWLRQLSE